MCWILEEITEFEKFSIFFTIIIRKPKLSVCELSYYFVTNRNNEIQFAGELQPRGCSYNLKVPNDDLKVLDAMLKSLGFYIFEHIFSCIYLFICC